jgi:dienelactone hydrolase
MWRSLTRSIDLLVALMVRRKYTGLRSRRTDPADLERILAGLDSDLGRISPPPPPVREDQVRQESDEPLWGAEHLRFWMPSAVASPIPENRIIWGEILTPRGQSPQSPHVVLIHPWIGPCGQPFMKAFARPLLARGLCAVAPEMPHHFHRVGENHWSGELAVCGDLVAMVRAAVQTVSDLQGVIAWLRSRGATQVGVMGYSLGGWAAAMLAALDPDLALCMAAVAPVDAEATLRTSPLTAGPIRRDIEESHLSDGQFDAVCRALSPLIQPARLAPDRLLVVSAVHDALLDPAGFDLLAAHWGCEIWREPHGHITLYYSRRFRRRAAEWIAERLRAPGRPGAR